MKTRAAIFAIALLVVPALALAEEGGVSVGASVEVHASSTKPKPPIFPKPGDVVRDIKGVASTTRNDIKTIASTTRADVRMVASTTREAIKARLDAAKDLFAQKRDTLETHIDAAKEKAREKFSSTTQQSVANIVDHLSGAADDLGSVAVRLDAFIKTKQTAGVNMDASVDALAQATTDIATANDKIAAVSDAITTALANKTPKADLPKIRTAVKAAEDALKVAKESLRATLQQIKVDVSAGATTNTNI